MVSGFHRCGAGRICQILLELKLWERYERQRLRQAGRLPEHPNAQVDASNETNTRMSA